MSNWSNIIGISAILWGLTISTSFAQSPTIAQTKTRIQQLDQKITSLKKNLLQAHDQHGLLNRELANNEKKIHADLDKFRAMQQHLAINQKNIAEIEKKAGALNEKLSKEQNLLAQHVRLRYQMGEYQPMKWLLNQDAPHKTSRLITLHQYLMRSREKIIQTIAVTKTELAANQTALASEANQLKIIENAINRHLAQLKSDKRSQTAVIQTLYKEINHQEQALQEFEHNKQNLAQLMKTLALQNNVYANQPFTIMRHKLQSPVAKSSQNPIKTNQGVIFHAPEGSVVHAVYPGRIVFSDWLNGYGLLLIIDHGRGFMTLYAHNKSFIKHKGEAVLAGTEISTVGHSGTSRQSGLYFEVRQRGKAVSPLAWLSKSGT